VTGPIFIDKQSRAVYRSMAATSQHASAAAKEAGLDHLLVELVNIRISQINGCAYCLDLHVRRALNYGESERRLAVLPAWRDTELFTVKEQAALTLAESITLLPDSRRQEQDSAFAGQHLTPDEFSAVCWIAITINAFNRVSIVSKHPVRPATG
jgi:AhpD family alkylhydroperoxidase